MDCTFEEGWCNYFHDPTGDFEWERTNTATPSSNTGPGFGMLEHSLYTEQSFTNVSEMFQITQLDQATTSSSNHRTRGELIVDDRWLMENDVSYLDSKATSLDFSPLFKLQQTELDAYHSGRKTSITSLQHCGMSLL